MAWNNPQNNLTLILTVILCSCASGKKVAQNSADVAEGRANVKERMAPLVTPQTSLSSHPPHDFNAGSSDEVVEREISMAYNANSAGLRRHESLPMKSLSLEQVSRDLGIPRNALAENTRHLALYLGGSKGLTKTCAHAFNENFKTQKFGPDAKLCQLIDDMENTRSGNKSGVSIRERRVPVRPEHFSAQQKMRFERLALSLEKEPAARILAWMPQMLKTRSCPRNLSAAAIRRIETLLPSTQAKLGMEKLYEHAAACLQPNHDGYEFTHFRQALLRQLWGNKDAARKSINRALLATESTERFRVLYWAGLLQTNPRLQESIWNRLVEEHPLSYHALEVWRHRGQDPLKVYSKRENFDLSRQALDRDANQGIRWLEALYVQGHIEAAQRLTRWMARHYQSKLSSSNLLYISMLKSSRGTPLNSISFLTRQIAENPEILNDQTLKMLFPKPYFEVFDRASPNTDTYLIMGVARQESGFNPRARSRANAQGLLQLLPSTARMLSGKRTNNLYDTTVNAELGVRFLSKLIEQFGSVEKALAGYNAGPGRIPQWEARFPTQDTLLFMDLVPFKETRNYVPSILRNNYWYARLYRGQQRKLASEMQSSQLVEKLVTAHSGIPNLSLKMQNETL